MAKVRPLSLREILKATRNRPVMGRSRLYLITEMELRALSSAFYRLSRRRAGRSVNGG